MSEEMAKVMEMAMVGQEAEEIKDLFHYAEISLNEIVRAKDRLHDMRHVLRTYGNKQSNGRVPQPQISTLSEVLRRSVVELQSIHSVITELDGVIGRSSND